MRRKDKGDKRNDPWMNHHYLSSGLPLNCWGLDSLRGADVEHIESLKSCFIPEPGSSLVESVAKMNHDWQKTTLE